MKSVLCAGLMAALFVSTGLGAVAASPPAASPTPDVGSMNQSELNAHAYGLWREADLALNLAYAKLVARAGNGTAARTLLLKAQLAWIPYRDAHSEFAGDVYRGGSLSPLIQYQAMRVVTELRTRDMKDLATTPSNEVEPGAGDAQALKFVDAELNQVYKKLMAGEDKPGRAILQKAELAWIRFRDAECAFEYALVGAGQPGLKTSCLLHLTDARLTELKDLLEERKPH